MKKTTLTLFRGMPIPAPVESAISIVYPVLASDGFDDFGDTNETSQSLTVPSDVQDNDTLFVGVLHPDNEITAPSGWSLITRQLGAANADGDLGVSVYRRVMSASDASSVHTWSKAGSPPAGVMGLVFVSARAANGMPVEASKVSMFGNDTQYGNCLQLGTLNATYEGQAVLNFHTRSWAQGVANNINGLADYTLGPPGINRTTLRVASSYKTGVLADESTGGMFYDWQTVGSLRASDICVTLLLGTTTASQERISGVFLHGATFATAATKSFYVPANVEDNDVLFAIFFAYNAVTEPAGWSLVTSQANGSQTLYVYSKTLSSSDANATVTWSQSSAAWGMSFVMVRRGDGSVASVLDYDSNTSGSSHAVPTVTADSDGVLGLLIASCEYTGTYFDEPSGWGDIFWSKSDVRLQVAHKFLNSGDSTSGLSFSHQGATHATAQIALLIG